jgi:hypothetical protein
VIVAEIIKVLFKIVSGLLSLLPGVSWDVDSVSLTNFYEAIRMLFYFFPVDCVFPIVTIIVSVCAFRVVVSLVKTIWALIPFL